MSDFTSGALTGAVVGLVLAYLSILFLASDFVCGKDDREKETAYEWQTGNAPFPASVTEEDFASWRRERL